MTSLQYSCNLGLAEIKTLRPRDKKIYAKDAGCAGNKITVSGGLNYICRINFLDS